jgi:hypothetical protein
VAAQPYGNEITHCQGFIKKRRKKWKSATMKRIALIKSVIPVTWFSSISK